MNERINNYKIYYYLFVVFLLVAFCVYYAVKESANAQASYMVVINEKCFCPPDIVPHIREIKDEGPRRPSDISRDDWNDYTKAKDELDRLS